MRELEKDLKWIAIGLNDWKVLEEGSKKPACKILVKLITYLIGTSEKTFLFILQRNYNIYSF